MSGFQIESVEIPFPIPSTQCKIASILSAYDDLIENNLRRIKILEEMAQSLYREWFVKFRFPGHEKVRMVDSPLGRIPEGWDVQTLGELSEVITKGTTPTTLGKKFQDEGINFFKVESIDEHGGILEDKLAKISLETHKLLKRSQLQEGDILFSIAGAIGRTAILPRRLLPANTNQALAIIRLRDLVIRTYLYHCIRADTFQHFSLGRVVQTAQANVSLGVLKSALLVIPERSVLTQFVAFTSPILVQKNNLRSRDITLRQTRDLLLPRLISGELDVSDMDINTSALDEQTDIDSPESPDTKPTSTPKISVQVMEPDQEDASKSSEEEPPPPATEAQPISIDQWETNEILAVLRSVGRGRGFVDREEFIRQAARELGYQRVGTRIGSALKGHIMAALRRRVLEKNGDGVRVATPSIIDYETDELVETLCSIARKGQRLNREEAIREAAEYLGFQRVTERVQTILKNAIRAAIRRGIFDGDRGDIWRVN